MSPPLPRWNDTYLSPSESLTQLGDWLGSVSPTGSVVTWVPGHDASLGPGYTVAVIAAETWGLPLVELATRRQPLRSAIASTFRPTLDQQLASLHISPPRALRGDVVVVDNTIGTGASILAAATALTEAGISVSSLLAITSPACYSKRRHCSLAKQPSERIHQ